MANDINWSVAVWKEINDDVVSEMGKVRIAQKVFPTTVFDNNPTDVPDEVINFADLSIEEGVTKPFVEIYAEFSLTSTQVMQEDKQHTCRTLAKMAAKALALAEDKYFFQTSDRSEGRKVQLPANVKIDHWRTKQDLGLLAEASPVYPDDRDDETRVSQPIDVPPEKGPGNATWGEKTFRAVTDGIARLVGKAQAPKFALFLPTKVYADTFVPPSPGSLVTTADRIKPLVEGGFYCSSELPEQEGLLVALGGEPIKLYVGREATTEFVKHEGSKSHFRVVERVQYVVRDPRSLVLLQFKEKGATQATQKRTN